MSPVFQIEDVYRKVSEVPAAQIVSQLKSRLSDGDCTWVSFVYFAALEMGGWYAGQQESKYAESLRVSNFVLADGIAFRLLHFAFRNSDLPGWKILANYPKYSRLAVPNLNGTDFLPTVLGSFSSEEARVVMYGTTPENLPRAMESVRTRFGLRTEGAHGYAPFPESLLNGNDPVILLVGLGTPKQERWILEHVEAFRKRGNILVFGVGGLFDFWGGLEKRAPGIVRRLGLEWFWRLVTFPRKNFAKATASLKFFWYLLRR